MKQSQFKWEKKLLTDEQQTTVEEFKQQNLSPLMSHLLVNRGLTTIDEVNAFLNPSLEDCHDPFLMYDMEKAVTRIQEAVASGERMLIYGDYDADGVTSTTVLKEAIELIGGEVEYYLPDRFTDGYGPNLDVYKYFIEQGIQLIITVDNGVSGHEALAYAKEQGTDVIVTDHHELPDELPEAYAIIHPRHPLGDYPFKDLAGVGVAFKVATALLGELPMESLDLVAIGTIADLVSLTGENRALVSLGLKILNQSERVGLHALAEVGSIDLATADEETVGFGIGPRINAMGRLKNAMPAVELLSTFDEEEAMVIAKDIQETNSQRQQLVKKITKEALQMVEEMGEQPIYLLEKDDWHEGVLGIVASHIVRQTQRPAIIMTTANDGELLKGSGRSIADIDLFHVLSEVKEKFTSFGGHHMAAGLSFERDNLDEVRQSLSAIVDPLIDGGSKDSLDIETDISIEDVSVDVIEEMKKLAPFGTDNPSPIMMVSDVRAEGMKKIGADGNHLKGQLVQGSHQLDCIAFGKGDEIGEMTTGGLLDVVGKLSINEWNGFRKAQLMLEDYRVSGVQIFDMRGGKLDEFDSLAIHPIFVVFNKETKVDSLPQDKVYYIHELQDVDKLVGFKELVFVDCPYDLEVVSKLVSSCDIERLYLWLNITTEHYLSGIPTREQFGKVFKLLHAQGNLDVRYKLDDLSNYLQISKNHLIFIIKVFFDLGFVTIEDGLMSKVANPSEKALEESDVYQAYLHKIDMERLFLYSNVADIRQWISQQEEDR